MIRILLSLALLLSQCCSVPKYSGANSASGGTGTWTLVQSPTSPATSSTSTLSIPLTQTTAAGNLLVFVVMNGNAGGGNPAALPVSIDKGGPLSVGLSCASHNMSIVAYVLPKNSTAATSPITMTFNSASSPLGYTETAKLYEFHPSANGANVGLDDCQAIDNVVASTSAAGPAFTWSGTNDAEVQYVGSDGVGSNISSIAAICNFGTEMDTWWAFAACPAPTSGSSVSWTLGSSDTTATMAAAFGFNVSAGVDQSFNDFEGGTSGSTPTVAQLTASQHGWSGGIWGTPTADVQYDSTASMPLANATGRLYGDGVNYASGQGSLGLSIVGNGVSGVSGVTYLFDSVGISTDPGTSMVASVKYDDNFASTDTTDIDCFAIHGQVTDFAAVNCYGAGGPPRYFNLETAEGNGTCTAGPNCTVGGSGHVTYTASTDCPCTLVLKYNTGNGTTGGTQEMDVYNNSNVLLGSATHAGEVAFDPPEDVELANQNTVTLATGIKVKFDSLQISLNSTVPNR